MPKRKEMTVMKRKNLIYMIITACPVALSMVLLFCLSAFISGTSVKAATQEPVATRLYAAYNGPAVKVGEKYDKSKLSVTIYYDMGGARNLEESEYTVSTDIVEKTGQNTILVMYRDLVTNFHITGRALTGINVSPKKYDYGLGNMPDCQDLYVTGTYSDGSVETIEDGFEIFPKALTSIGQHEVTVLYEGKQAKCSVYARNWTDVVAINATFNGEEIIADCPINKNDFTVMVVYSDMLSERITTFSMSTDMFHDSGTQSLTISYGGMSKTIQVNVIERYVVGMRAEYTGGDVLVGRKLRRDNLHVYLKYVDGGEAETTEYTLHSLKIGYIGDNLITVYYGDKFSADVTIKGVEVKKPDFDYASIGYADNGKQRVRIDTAIPKYLDKDSVTIKSLTNKSVKKAYRKLKLKEGSYIAFEYGFKNPDDELELPLTVRITIPEGFDPEHTFLYYCPNRKSILGRMNKKAVDSDTFEFTLFKAGTYMLVCSDELTENVEK